MKMLQNQRDEKLLCGKDSLDFRNSCYIICLNQRREIVGDTFLLLEEKSSKCELNKKKTHVLKVNPSVVSYLIFVPSKMNSVD